MVQIKYPNKPITKPQIKKIHTLLNNLKLSDEYYRALLHRYEVESSTELTRERAAHLIDMLSTIYDDQQSKSKTQKPTGVMMKGRLIYFDRTGKITDKQIDYIAGLWLKLSDFKTYESLMCFIKRITGKLYLHIESLNMIETRKVINALKSWDNSTSKTSKEQR